MSEVKKLANKLFECPEEREKSHSRGEKKQ
jgi:hypothetical protein